MKFVTDNQGKCCDAVLRFLEERLKAILQYVRRDSPSSRDVEVVCDIGSIRFALEHTRLDPYPNKVEDDIALSGFMEPVLAELNQRLELPDETSYDIAFESLALTKIKRSKHQEIGVALVSWVLAVAPQLQRPPLGRFTARQTKLDGFPTTVTLRRTFRQHTGIFYSRFEPLNLESRRAERISRALRDKVPKLAVCKRAGMRTVLVLENNDLAISNHSLIAVSVHNELRSLSVEVPDEIFLVDASAETLWTVFVLKNEAQIWPSTVPDVVEHREFDAATLVDILAAT